MREIKYRQLVYNADVKDRWHYWGFIEGAFVGPIIGAMNIEDAHEYSQEFTGLHDKNGREIYEGDIVKSTRFNWREPTHPKHGTNLVTIYRIYWNEERHGFWETMKFPTGGGMSSGLGFKDDRADRTEIEVIGNIYENPESRHIIERGV
jgi:uncharacterized phage protein (TIGR01671 family)